MVAISLTLKTDMNESNECYATEDVDSDENLGVDESDLISYDTFEDTEVTSEDFISIKNLNFIEEDLFKLLTTVDSNIPVKFID